jgi:D-glycero-alpha-D-manno-heptose-7-phosphate kinase
VCNIAISLHARVHLDAGRPREAAEPLVAAALARAGLDASVRVENAFPVGAGLGGSSAAGVALQAAIARAAAEPLQPEELVLRSRTVEVEDLGIAGGWQDHYAAAYGGLLALELGRATRVDRIAAPPAVVESLERRCLLVYTGETRISSANITAVIEAYAAGNPRVAHALAAMAALARGMVTALRDGDIDALGALVGEHWVHQRALHPAITTERIEAITSAASAAGALGAKALGASGGGCVVIVTPPDPEAVRRAITRLGTILPFSIDFGGATVEDAA